MTDVDPLDRTVKVEAWVDGRRTTVVFVVHSDQVTIVSGPGRTIEIQASLWRLVVMRVVILMARFSRHPDRP